MQSNFIVRLDDHSLFCFYFVFEKGIHLRRYVNGRWSQPDVLVEDAKPNYTVNISKDGKIYIFCQDGNNNINLCSNRSGEWKVQLILQNQHSAEFDIIFNAIITENGLNLLYNVPNPDAKSHTLVSQLLNQRGQWGKANRIDSFFALPNHVFQMQAITCEHGLIFYQMRTPEINLGYREIDAENIGDFNIFYTTTYPVVDYSFLTTDSAVHVAFIVKGMFGCQLIYRMKTDKTFSNPVIVWEGQKFENCLMTYVKGSLKISFVVGEQLYVCTAENGNTKFSAPIRYRNKFCQNPMKATYLSYNQMTEKDYYCREIYVDSLCQWDIQVLPDMHEDFYPTVQQAAIPEQKETQSKGKYEDELLEEMDKMKKQLELAQLQILEKDKKIKKLLGDRE